MVPDIRCDVKMDASTSLSLPIVRTIDMDSGRGESGSENDDFVTSDLGLYYITTATNLAVRSMI